MRMGVYQAGHNYASARDIVPRSVKRSAQNSLHTYDGSGRRDEEAPLAVGEADDVAAVIAEIEEEMQDAAERLDFERAALLRDQIKALKTGEFRKPAGSGKAAKLYAAPKSAGGSKGRRR